ncbi:MAG TPA: LuxR C-terminal-related transcriptional regulator [Bryobacteraceae bacterium]|nr:LuxR C-terminal-related transcriptional regulator [Bryobacteraceae bacterium]
MEQLEKEAAEAKSQALAADLRFRLVADAAPVMFWMSGPDSLCTFVGKPWLDFRGRTLEQELGTGWLEGVHPDDRNVCFSTYMTAFHQRRDFRLEYRLKRADGAYCWIVDTGVPRYEPDGSFAGYVGCGVEVDGFRPILRNGTAHSVAPVVNPLTCREQQVVKLVADGKSTKEIAALLGISYKTADSHRTKIMEKLRVHETASLVRWAVRAGLVQA